MHSRSLVLLLLAGLAVAVLAAPAESRAAQTAHAANAKRLIVTPRAGQVVRWHHVRVRVRSRSLADTLRVRLNGTRVGADFGRPDRGVRTLRASLSHGLRRGGNVLRVTVRPPRGAARTARLRFVVRTKRHLVGAGRDRLLAVGGKVRIRGHVKRATRRGAGAKLRWKLIRAPRRGRAHAALLGAAPPHTLTSAARSTAAFRPRVPGSYELRLSAGSGSRAASDRLKLDVAPRNKLVPIETMATEDAHSDKRGIRVGDTTYLLRDAVDRHQTHPRSVLQALVLHRLTLGLEWNRRYSSASDLARDLSELDDTKLVIVVMQPGPNESYDYGPLQQAVDRIGAPHFDPPPKGPGLISVIGVPGLDPGDADVNVVAPGRLGSMTGYLTPDLYKWFGFVPSERAPFTFKPEPSGPCTPASNGGQPCDERVGFRVRHLDSRTLAPAAHDGEIYSTNGRNLDDRQKLAEVGRMAADLAAFPPENVVMIETVSNRRPGEAQYRPPIGWIPGGDMHRLANEVQLVGGTLNGFNRIALKPGSEASGGLTYALVGWKGSHEGAGAEVAAGVDGAGDAPSLSGVLRPDRESRFRPAASDSGPNALSELVLDEPTNEWPLSKACRPSGMRDDDAGANLAIGYLGSTNEQIGSDPRSAYALQLFDEAGWDKLAAKIAAAKYSTVPDSRRPDFTQAQFRAGRCQLATELEWVGNVRAYLTSLKAPFAESALTSYGHAQTLADAIYKETHSPDDDVAMRWTEFVEILLRLGGAIPGVGEVTETLAGVMELAVWGFDGDEHGAPPDDELRFKAHELGDELQTQMVNAAKTYDRIGDVIVTDSAKLGYVGTHGDCNPTEPACPRGYSFTADDKQKASSDLYRSVERLAYEELLPLAFGVFGLNPQRRAEPPDPKWYYCSGPHPFSYYSPLAVSMATTPLLRELDPTAPSQNLWKLLVLARHPAITDSHGQPPSDKLLARMFGAVPQPGTPSYDNPGKGGLGISPSRLMSAAKWHLWAEDDRGGHRTGNDRCH